MLTVIIEDFVQMIWLLNLGSICEHFWQIRAYYRTALPLAIRV